MSLSTRFALALLVACSSTISAQSITVEPKPSLILGDATNDTNQLFGAGLVGATRLPDGTILVADRGSFSLKLFGADGHHIRDFGRKGNGPGEFNYLAHMWRCGDRVYAYDIEGYQTSVFTTSGNFERLFRFGSPEHKTPYASACNAAGVFAHYGWGDFKKATAGIHRLSVPVWVSNADSGVRKELATIQGSERWGDAVDGRLRGTRPLPLGRQPVIAIGSDRVFVGTGEKYEILVYDFQGNRLGAIRKPGADIPVTRADIDLELSRELAGATEAAQQRTTKDYATFEFPKMLPAYTKMMVDSDGLLWVADYPRGKGATLRWTIFEQTGKQVSEVLLPAWLEVSEIGRDYVLGKYVDRDDDIPQIRIYRLHRAAR
jgi:hypothetical protein